MKFEFIISLVIFVTLFIVAFLWQPTRFILKEVFKNPLKDSPDRIISNYKAEKKETKEQGFDNKSRPAQV